MVTGMRPPVLDTDASITLRRAWGGESWRLSIVWPSHSQRAGQSSSHTAALQAVAAACLSAACLSAASLQTKRGRVRHGRTCVLDRDAYGAGGDAPQFTDSELRLAFRKLDKNGNGTISPEEFLQICSEELALALPEVELRRLFANLDTNKSGELTFAKFRHGIQRNALLRTVAFSFKHQVDINVPDSYDYSLPTYLAHRHEAYRPGTAEGTSSCKVYSPAVHGEVYGEFAEIRRSLDYSWHTNYTRERQAWQDQVVRRVAQCTKFQNRPWVVFTCGAMGSGKGYTMSWLSKHNIFPLEHIVHIDPDHFKAQMPEWQGYIAANSEEAGTMCHKESGFLQEVAQEVAMLGSQNVWIDGSLGDHQWYSMVFRRIRERFPKYRIALMYVYCDPDQLVARIKKRARKTGRVVPERKLEESMRKTREAVDVLSPLTDFSARIDNRGDIPWLQVCQDRSHSFVTLRNQFGLGRVAKSFPKGLRDVSVKHHELLSEQLAFPEGTLTLLQSESKDMQRVPLLSACRARLRARLEAEMKSRLDILDMNLELLVTPAAEVNMDAHSRRRADIPEAARFCAMCHGCCTSEGRQVKILPGFSRGTSAFVYMGADGEIVGVNVLARHLPEDEQFFVQCAKPIGLPGDMDWKLELSERWVRQVTPREALGAADAMAWVLPGELPECPFGGFAYRLSDGPEVVFPVVPSE